MKTAQADITQFVGSENFKKLPMTFDITKLRQAFDEVMAIVNFENVGVNAICLTQIPGDSDSYTGGNLRGIYWTRIDDSGKEVVREKVIDEAAYSQFVTGLSHTYFKTVYQQLSQVMTLGRVRLLKAVPRTSLSWHRDPEPRIHLPIITNPGAMMLIDNHCTHMPADGSIYFTDTTHYHSVLNGGEADRIHMVATVVAMDDDFKKQLI